MQVIFTPPATRHLESLHEYVRTHASQRRADDYVDRIVAFCKGLTTFPCGEHSATTCCPDCP